MAQCPHCGRSFRSDAVAGDDQAATPSEPSPSDFASFDAELTIFKEMFNGLDLSDETKMELSERANLHKVARNIRLALRIPDAAQAVPDPEASIPTYGSIPWDQLGRDVVEAQIGTRRDFEYDPKFYPGHQMVGINFNSLARIVDKYRLASAISSTEGK